MNNIEELKNYKTLLDQGIISQNEFEIKKTELLNSNLSNSTETNKNNTNKNSKFKINKKAIKIILILIITIYILNIFRIGITNIIIYNQGQQRAKALQTEIQPIMYSYGLKEYTVKAINDSPTFNACISYYVYEVFAENFESLTKIDAYYLLEELDEVSVSDPCKSNTDINLKGVVHPGKNIKYYYWSISPSDIFGKGEKYLYKTPGIYCNKCYSDSKEDQLVFEYNDYYYYY